MEAWREELYHHGILGMKWGVRRYQNKDGSLTAAGRTRYGYSEKDQKALYKSAKSLSKSGTYQNIKRFDKKLNQAVSDEQKQKLSRLNKEWNKIAKESLEADDKLYDMVDNTHTIESVRKAHPDLAKKVDEGNKVWDEYHTELKATVDSIIGSYGDKTISEYKHLGYVQTGKDYVEAALHQMSYNDWYSAKLDPKLKT